MDFYSSYAQGFARVAACTLPIDRRRPRAQRRRRRRPGARARTTRAWRSRVFPELCLSGYAIDDLLLQDPLLDAVDDALARVAEATSGLRPVVVVGAPLETRLPASTTARVVIHDGTVLGVAPKSYLPTYREFYERRHFAPGDDQRGQTIDVAGDRVPFGPDLLFRATDVPGFVLHVEVCEDMWVPVPPSHEAALAGATVLANISGSPITVSRAEDRHLLARSASARCLAAYLYAAAGEGESSTDLSWDGMTMVYENGALLAESERFPEGARASVADIDLDLLRQERQRQGTFDDNRRTLAAAPAASAPSSSSSTPPTGDIGLLRKVDRFPFVPDDEDAPRARLLRGVQHPGLRARAAAARHRRPKIVIGVCGGLDSTHALIVAAKAMDRLDRPRSDILAFTMPGFATSDHTKSNAIALMESLDVTWEELDIRPAATQMLEAMGHPSAGARRSTTSPSRTSRPACAPTTSSASPTSAAASCSAPATCPSSPSAGAPTASVTR